MNIRRDLLIVLGASTLTPRSLFAQAKQPVLIGWLSLTSRESGARSFAVFKDGLGALGWKEGSQFLIEARWADGQEDRLASLTQELAAKKPALIVASTLRVVRYAAKAAPMMPIVMVTDTDPVSAGLVTSLARPGGLITGLAGFGVEICGKYLELLLAAAPKVKRVGFLAPSDNPNSAGYMKAARGSAAHYGVEARFVQAARPEDIEPALLQLVHEGAQGLVVLPGALFQAEQQRIVRFALLHRWPMVAGPRAFAEGGALLSYGADWLASHRRAAYYVDRILNGTKPADLPIEQPTTFEFVVNLKTAKALGLTMPAEIMVRADRVIE